MFKNLKLGVRLGLGFLATVILFNVNLILSSEELALIVQRSPLDEKQVA